MTRLSLFTDHLKATFPAEAIKPVADHYFTGGEWVTPCMCGHEDHGGGRDETMCCDTDGCDCGGYERQPGCARPTIRNEGRHQFFALIGGGK